MADIQLSDDGNFIITSSGDVALVDNNAELLQDIRHRLMTYPGDLWYEPEYGSRLLDYIQTEQTPINQQELLQEIRLGINADDRIDSSKTEVNLISWDERSIVTRATFQKATETPETEESFIIQVDLGAEGVNVT